MGKPKLKIIETETETTTVERERSNDVPKETEEPLGSEADQIVAAVQTMNRKFMSSTTAKEREKGPKKN
jgi:hypothetical protein